MLIYVYAKMDSNMQFYNLKLPNPSSISSFTLLKKKKTPYFCYIFLDIADKLVCLICISHKKNNQPHCIIFYICMSPPITYELTEGSSTIVAYHNP